MVQNSTLPNGAHLWLYAKPLDAAIGRVPEPYHPGGSQSHQFWLQNTKHLQNTIFIATFVFFYLQTE